jgi:hypothetical protein
VVRKRQTAMTRKEENYFRSVLDQICPPAMPVIKVYRIKGDRTQVCVFTVYPDDFKGDLPIFSENVLKEIHNHCGPGKYLLRTVHSNGRFGPSRIVHLG